MPPVGTGDPRDGMTGGSCGMTLRDYFAAAALQGFISDTSIPASIKVDATLLSRSAFQVADAMLKARGDK